MPWLWQLVAVSHFSRYFFWWLRGESTLKTHKQVSRKFEMSSSQWHHIISEGCRCLQKAFFRGSYYASSTRHCEKLLCTALDLRALKPRHNLSRKKNKWGKVWSTQHFYAPNPLFDRFARPNGLAGRQWTLEKMKLCYTKFSGLCTG